MAPVRDADSAARTTENTVCCTGVYGAQCCVRDKVEEVMAVSSDAYLRCGFENTETRMEERKTVRQTESSNCLESPREDTGRQPPFTIRAWLASPPPGEHKVSVADVVLITMSRATGGSAFHLSAVTPES